MDCGLSSEKEKMDQGRFNGYGIFDSGLLRGRGVRGHQGELLIDSA